MEKIIVPKVNISEHTDRPEFIDSLKQKLGVQFRVFQELIAQSLKEDIIIFRADAISVDLQNNTINWNNPDAVIGIIETKIKGETNIEKHEPQLLKYIQQFSCRLGFITNYVDLISYEYASDYTVKKNLLSRNEKMDVLAEDIANFIENSTKITIQKSPEKIMKYLEDSINGLLEFTKKVNGDKWEKILRFSDEPEKEAKKKKISNKDRADRDLFFQRSAAYVAITQLLFYIVFRLYRIEQNININPTLRPLSSSNGYPSQIQEIIEDVPNGNLNFKAIFGKNKDVFSQLEDDASSILKGVIQTLEGVSGRFVIQNDLIGQIFQRLMPFEVRKKFAAFYTLRSAANLLCKLAIHDKNAIVYDPACGSGTLLVYAYHRKKELGLNIHQQLLKQIKGSDISDIATMMSTVNLAIQDPSKWTNEVQIYPHDAFELITGLTRFSVKTQETPDGRKKVSPIFSPNKDYRVDVLLANPPFTRGSRLSEPTKAFLRHLRIVEDYSIPTNFKAINLYAFFLLIAPDLVKLDNGIIAFILPQGAINSDCMVPVWQALFSEGFGIKYIVEASDLDESFSDSEDQEIFAILQRNYTSNVRFVKLFGSLSSKDLNALAKQIETNENPVEKTQDCLIQIFSQKEVQTRECVEWTIYPSPTLILLYAKYLPLDKNRLNDEEQSKYDHDLSETIKLVPENASRPVEYWYIPNKFWSIEEIKTGNISLKATSENTVITEDPSKNQTLLLPLNAFVPAIARSLSDYSNNPPEIPESAINNYFLVDETRPDVKKYCAWGVMAHEAKLFGESHSKYSPFENDGGIVKRINYLNSKTLALRFQKPLVGTATIRIGFTSSIKEDSDLFFAYLTSSLFMLDTMEKSRTRSGEFILINQVDFYKIFRFPDITNLKRKGRDTILSASKIHNSGIPIKERPFIQNLIKSARIDKENSLRKLDETWFSVLDIPLTYLDTLYQEIEDRLNDLIKKQRRRLPENE